MTVIVRRGEPPHQPSPRRKADKYSRLHAFIASHRKSGFAWGTTDCCRFAFGAIAAMTGRPVAGLPAWSDMGSALRAVKGLGADLAAAAGAIAAANRWPPVSVAYAQRGDLVALPAEPEARAFGCALGICVGQHALTIGANGLTAVPMAKALAAWRVA